MKIYAGSCENGTEVVTVNGTTLDPRFDLVTHSPTGFSWGYGGSGPAQLAIAILADCVGPTGAKRFYQDFKWQVVCHWVLHEPWTITEAEIRAWVAEAQAERDRSAMATQFDADLDAHPLEN